jgi:hypothetical protein
VRVVGVAGRDLALLVGALDGAQSADFAWDDVDKALKVKIGGVWSPPLGKEKGE